MVATDGSVGSFLAVEGKASGKSGEGLNSGWLRRGIDRFLSWKGLGAGKARAQGPVCEGLEVRQMMSVVSPISLEGSEFNVNTSESNNLSPTIASSSNGMSVVVWGPDDGSEVGIAGQRYAADGSKLGGEFLVNTRTTSFQIQHAAAMAGDGSFVVVWADFGGDGDGYSVEGQRYQSDGSKLGGQFTINTTVANSQDDPAVAMAGDGSFVVVWRGKESSTPLDTGIYGQRYDSKGNKVGTEFAASSPSDAYRTVASVAMADDGSFVAVWESSSHDGDGYGIVGQLFDGFGVKSGSEFVVNSYITGFQTGASVAMTGDGAFVVLWESAGQDGSDRGVYGQRFDADGKMNGAEFLVNTSKTTGTQMSPSIAMRDDGSFMAVWASSTLFPSYDAVIMGQYFDVDGSALGENFQISTTTYGLPLPSVAEGAGDTFTAVWTDRRSTVYGQYGQRMSVSTAPIYNGEASYNLTAGKDFTLDLNDLFDDFRGGVSISLLDDTGVMYTGDEIGAWSLTDGMLSIDVVSDVRVSGSLILEVRATDTGSEYVDQTISFDLRATLGVIPVGAEEHPGGGLAMAQHPVTVQLTGGTSVMVWGDAINQKVIGQFYDADGNATGGSVQLYDRLFPDAIFEVRATALADGGFAVAWVYQNGSAVSLRLMRFDASGHAVGSQIEAHSGFMVSPFADNDNVAIAGLADGGVVVSWLGIYGLNDVGQVARVFSGDTWTAGDAFEIQPHSKTYRLTDISAAGLTDGGFVISWRETTTGISGAARVYNADGSVRSGVVVASDSNPIGTGGGNSKVTATPDGGFALGWIANGSTGNAVYVTYGDKNGVLSAPQRASDEDVIVQSDLDVAAKDDGTVVVIWEGKASVGDDNQNIYMRAFNAASRVPDGYTAIVNSYRGQAQSNPSAGFVGEDQDVLVTWTGASEGSALNVAHAQRLALAIPTPPKLGLIPVVGFQENGKGRSLDLDDYFSDDFGAYGLTYSLISNSNAGLLGVGFDAKDGTILNITPAAFGYGAGVITVRATDEYGFTVDAAIHVGVEASPYRYITPVSKGVPAIEIANAVELDMASAADGSYVQVWANGLGVILGMRYGADGTPVGKEFVIHESTESVSFDPSVGSAFDGSFVAAWVLYEGGETDVYARRYDATGAAMGDAFLVNTIAGGFEDSPEVAVGADGRFVVAWGAADGVVRGQQFDAQGNRVRGEITLSASGGAQREVAVAMGPDGSFVATWTVDKSSTGGDAGDIYAQIFDWDGGSVGAFAVDAAEYRQSQPAVSVGAGGQFVIAWKSSGIAGQDIAARLYNADGTPLAGAFEVSDGSVDGDMPGVTMGAQGTFVVTWFSTDVDDNRFEVLAQRYDESGSVIGDAVTVVGRDEPRLYRNVTVSGSASGNFAVSWSVEPLGDLPGTIGSRSYKHAYQPYVIESIGDQQFWLGASGGVYDLDAYFGPSWGKLAFSVEQNTNFGLFSLAISKDGNLTIALTADTLGNGDITIKATALDGSFTTIDFNADVSKLEATITLSQSDMKYTGDLYDNAIFGLAGVDFQSINGTGGDPVIASSFFEVGPSGPEGDFALSLTGDAGKGWVTLLGTDSFGSLITGHLYVSVLDSVAPEFLGFKPLPLVRTTAVGSVDVFFSEAINVRTFNWESMTLTRDGGANLINATTGAGLTLTLADARTNRYRIDGLSALTNHIGDFVLTLADDGVSDAAGNAMGQGGAIGWRTQAAVPSAPVLGPSNPGPYEAGYTSSTTPTLVGTGTPGSKVELYDQLDQLLATVTVNDSGTYSFTFGTLALGAYQVKARATGPVGFTTGYTSLQTFHVANNFVNALQITQFAAPVTGPVTAVGLQFSGVLDLASFTWEDLDIRRNGTGPNLSNSGINIVRVSPTSLWYRIDLPSAITATSGVYTLEVKRGGVRAADGKPIYNNIATTWTRNFKFTQINQFPTPISASMTAVGFQSAVELNLASLTWQDIEIKLDGVGPDLSTSGITIDRVSPTSLWYRINLPASLSVASGEYTIKVKAAGVLDKYGTPMNSDIQTTWTRNYQFAQINQYPTPVTTPMTLVGFQSTVELTLASLTSSSIRLTLNGGPNLSTSSITFERVSPTSLWYRIKLPPSMTLANGTYTLTVVGANVRDVYGHAIGGDLTTSWTKV
jgi:hypothetical protein